MTNPVLVEVTRDPRVESRHRAAIAVVDAAGRRRAAIGDVDEPIFPRSAVKALQALVLVESGAADRYGFGDAELALACAAHAGDPRHVETAARMLAAVGRGEADLECGPQWPLDREAANALVRAGEQPTALHNNCSGKHAGFIAAARHLGFDTKGYIAPDHPVQRQVTAVLAAMTGADLGPHVRGVDGCSIPAYAIPLANLAQAFARFVTGEGLSSSRNRAAITLRSACAKQPHMIAGKGRFCTMTTAQFGERVFVKVGGEGVFCAGFPDLGLGVALKCDDGAKRAAEAMMSAVTAAFVAMPGATRRAYARTQLTSRVGRNIGEIRVVDTLVEMLREIVSQPT